VAAIKVAYPIFAIVAPEQHLSIQLIGELIPEFDHEPH
jgi:hypothetical protein